MADKHAEEGYALLRREHSAEIRVDKTAKNEVGIFKGRSDALVVVNGSGFGFEAKYGKTGFKTRDKTGKVGWKPEQREWAAWFTSQNSSELFFWLVIGNRIGGKKYPRRAYIIPYSHFKAVIEQVEQFQDTLPYQLSSRSKGELKERQLDCVTQFKDFELVWRDSKWHIPENNPIQKILRRNESCQNSNTNHPSRRSTHCWNQRKRLFPRLGGVNGKQKAFQQISKVKKKTERKQSYWISQSKNLAKISSV